MSNKLKGLCILVFCLSPLFVRAHSGEYEAALGLMHLKEYSVVTEQDTIHFLATIPGGKKKTIVFCQGSGPVPLVIRLSAGLCYPFPFQPDSTERKEFNLVIISKPGLKRFATEADLSRESVRRGEMLQLDSLNRPPEKYTGGNSLSKLGGDCIDVIKFLKMQPWVNKDSIYVFGHSQGAMVAAYAACKDPADIRGLVYSQSNAYGTSAGYLSAMLTDPRLPAEEVNKKMDSVYRLQASLLSDKRDKDVYDTNTSRWRSLEEPPAIEYLLKLDMPILLLTGLADPGSLDNKNIPLDFMRRNKHNLTARFYPGYDHNFFKKVVDEHGNPKEPEFHWNDIFDDVRNWIGR